MLQLLRTHLQNTLGDHTHWNFRELLAQVMQNLNINMVGSLGHSCAARTARSGASVVVASNNHLEHLQEVDKSNPRD